MSSQRLDAAAATERDQLLSEDATRSNDGQGGTGAEVSGDAQESLLNHLPKLGATMFDFFTSGCLMAAVGVLLPNIERYYSINDATAAFIFPAGVLGYLGATASVQTICARFNYRGVAIATPVVRLLAAIVLSTGPPFFVALLAYLLLGFGTGLTDTAWNTWASSMHRPNVFQGVLHGSFSLGCIFGPMFADATLHKYEWNYFYLLAALLSCIELATQGWAFRHDGARSQPPLDIPSASPGELQTTKRFHPLRNKAIWICGIFYLTYQGVEATYTDWIVVYMRRSQNASPTTSSLASSIFWIGMAAGRYALGPVSERFGVGAAVTVCIFLGLCCQLAMNVAGNVTAILLLLAANGFFMGPLFPSGIVLLVSGNQSGTSMELVAIAIAMGQVGAALAPLAVGFMATHLGIQYLFAVVCGLSAAMLILWITFARVA